MYDPPKEPRASADDTKWFGRPVAQPFAALPPNFFRRVAPQPVSAPRLLHANADAAALLGLTPQQLRDPAFLATCAGQTPLPGMEPISTAYSGHQFGVWAGPLGDGRAHLLGEVAGPRGHWEVQLKGSGRTPFARMGDGRAVLRSSVREYLASEAMAGLGIPTTRALALVVSDDPVYRETVETAAIVTRLSPSFVRFGHFEHWARSHHELKALLAYVTSHDLPHCRVPAQGELDVVDTAYSVLSEVMRRTARLVAQWQLAGFCHGVMNTDNMSILGLTLDYGPYGFMDEFRIDHICNHSDTAGRYAWNAQPAVAQWNLYRLAESLLVLGCDTDGLKQCLQPYEAEFLRAYHAQLARKWGLSAWQDGYTALENDWWRLLHEQRADFTLAFRLLASAPENPEPWLALFHDAGAARAWLDRYGACLRADGGAAAPNGEPGARRQAMLRANPLYVLRNHLAQEAIAAAQQGDASVIERLLDVLRDPFAERPGMAHYAAPPTEDTPAVAVSCSS